MCTYLDNVGPTYYFRRAVPKELQPLVLTATGKPRSEFKISLRTKDRETAKRLIRGHADETDRIFDEARARLGSPVAPSPTPATAARDFTEADIEQMKFERQEDAGREARREELEDYIEFLRQRLKGSTREMPRELRAMAYLLEGHEFDRQLLKDQLIIARSEKRELEERTALPDSEAAQSNFTVTAIGQDGVMLDTTIVDLWAAERKVQPQGVSMYRAAVRWFYERIGRKPVDRIAKRDVIAFKAKLVEEGCTPANIKNKLSRLRTLLQWAADNGYASENAAAGVSIRDATAARNKRRSFDLASLNAIFGSPVYSKGDRPVRGRGEAAYWLPLLALFTGARREELGQLRPDDVVRFSYPDADGHEQSAWFLKLIETEDEGAETKLKNAESERLVPVHAELERLGFVRFAQAMKAQGKARIFHELRPNIHGKLTDKWGQWFTDYRRNVCGIADRRMVFHSFRHTFIDHARNAGIAEGVQRGLVGHGGEDVHDDYGSAYSLHRRVEGMKLYKVPGLKLAGIPMGGTGQEPAAKAA